jgi:hypothetical protein
MAKISMKGLSEKTQVELDVEIDGKPGKVLFQSTTKDKKDTIVSFDMGTTWVSLQIAYASISQYIDKYPFSIPQD